MIVSHRHRFVFVKTRKTAGTSIELALAAFCGPRDVLSWLRPLGERERERLGAPGPRNIRVPLGRYAAGDWWRLARHGVRAHWTEHLAADEIRRRMPPGTWERYFTFCVERNPWDKVVSYWAYGRRQWAGFPEDLRDFVASDALAEVSDWGLYTVDDEILVDRVLRYERLADELPAVLDRIGLDPGIELPRSKSGFRDRRPHWEVLGPQEARRIEEVFHREIRAFGYVFGEA